MQGRKVYQEKLFVNFQLSDHVPQDNLYRRILGLLDFEYLYKLTAKYYGREGQKSVDPVVLMKLMLVGYLENINSDRRIIEVSRLRMDILFFLGYDLGEPLPWHSTLSRSRQLYGQEVFTSMFQSVLSKCIDKGMLSGKRQAIDGFFIKANASLDNMVRRDILEDALKFAKELEDNVEEPLPRTVAHSKKNEGSHCGPAPKKSPSNQTHCNPRDPEAKMSVKPGKVTALNYLGEVSVDTSSHIITHIQAFTAEKRDSQCLPEVLENLKKNLSRNGLEVSEVVADKGFSSASSLEALDKMGIVGYIPNLGTFIFEREGFVYNPESDAFTCPNNLELTYAGTYTDGGYNNRHYRISNRLCKVCPLRDGCQAHRPGSGARIKQTVDRPFYERMHHRMNSKKAGRLMKQRQSTVEPVIGSLINHFGMKKVNTIGLAQANKCITMSGIAYNLKKLTKYVRSTKRKAMAQVKKAMETTLVCTWYLVLTVGLQTPQYPKTKFPKHSTALPIIA